MKHVSLCFVFLMLSVHPNLSENVSYNGILSKILTSTFQDCTKFFILLDDTIDNDLLSSSSEPIVPQDRYIWTVRNHHRKNFTQLFQDLSSLKDLHKKRYNCATAAFLLSNSFKLNAQQFIVDVVDSVVNVVQKDRDYFIFAHNKIEDYLADTFLSNPHISQRIRNKLVITPKNGQEIMLRTICPFCDNGQPNVVSILSPNLTNISQLFPNFLRNFHGKLLRVSSASETKWLNEIRPSKQFPGKWDAVRGIYVTVTMELAQRLNFTCDFFPSIGGGGTGYRFPNGTWIGTVADVYYGNSELGQVGGQTKGRYEAVDFTFPITYEWLTFTTGQPQTFYSWRGMYRPLSIGSWTMVFMACLTMTISFWVISHADHHSVKNVIPTSLRFVVKALLEQGSENVFRSSVSTWFRILCLFWLLFCLIVTTAYKSKLVSFLAFPSIKQPPKTLEGLALSDYKIILQYTGAAYQLYKTSKSPTYIKIVNKMLLEPSDIQCFKKVLHSKAACISWENIVNYVAYKSLSDRHGHVPLVKAVDARAYFLLGGIMMKKRTIFKMEFNMYIKSAMDSGLIEKWKVLDKEWILKERKEREKQGNQTSEDYIQNVRSSLNVQQLMGSFFLVGLGLCLGSITVAGEIIWTKWQSRRRRADHNFSVPEMLSKLPIYFNV